VPLDTRASIYNHVVVDELTPILAALADPTRRSILDRLRRGPATVGEIARPLRMTQQAVSKHVAKLERARLVDKRRVGRRHVCTLNAGPVSLVDAWVAPYRRLWEERLDRLAAHLDLMQRTDEFHDS